MYKSKRSKATDIPRSRGGLGTEKNIITVCRKCHNLLDQSAKREKMLGIAKRYLERIYGNIDKSEVKYAKSK